MKNVVLTTESCADISKEFLEKLNIPIVQFSVNFPDRTLLDGDFPVQDIYDFYNKTHQIPKTNAINPYQYTEFFERIAAENPGKEIIHIGYSSACSCSFQNATIGVQDCTNAKVHLVDALNVSGGLGNLALKAYEIIQENPDDTPFELVEKIESFVPKIKTAFVPDRLEFLVAGGRVSNTAALGANIFRIKPRIDIIDGKLIAGKKYMGVMKNIAPQLVSDFCKENKLDKKRVYAFYSLGANMEAVEAMKQALISEGFKEVLVWELGCVMTVHGGKGAVGISGIAI